MSTARSFRAPGGDRLVHGEGPVGPYGGTPAESPRGPHGSRLATWVGFGSVTVVTVLAVLVAITVRSAPRRGAEVGVSAAVATALRSLPPGGQASVAVEGLGRPGATGGATPVSIASVTKVMTAYVILTEHPIGRTEQGPAVTVDRTAADESVSGDESSVRVEAGQRLTERRLLELMLIPSGNNIARLLARWNAGTQDAFVVKMNRAARSLGMARTTYTGASGIEATTRSTATDQLKLARRVMRDAAFRSVVAERTVELPGGGGTVVNTDTLLGRYGVIGIKTGSSTPAGGALMWAARTKVGGTTRLLLGVVLHQHADTSPEEGLAAALDNSRTLIVALRRALRPDTATHGEKGDPS